MSAIPGLRDVAVSAPIARRHAVEHPFEFFSTVDAMLLKPLLYPQRQDLFALGTTFPDGGMTNGLVAPSELVRLGDPGLSILSAAGAAPLDATLIRQDGTLIQPSPYGVSEGFFDVFGLPMTAGNAFSPEYHAPGGPSGVILSHRFWREVFGGDPAGKGATLAGIGAALGLAAAYATGRLASGWLYGCAPRIR